MQSGGGGLYDPRAAHGTHTAGSLAGDCGSGEPRCPHCSSSMRDYRCGCATVHGTTPGSTRCTLE